MLLQSTKRGSLLQLLRRFAFAVLNAKMTAVEETPPLPFTENQPLDTASQGHSCVWLPSEPFALCSATYRWTSFARSPSDSLICTNVSSLVILIRQSGENKASFFFSHSSLPACCFLKADVGLTGFFFILLLFIFLKPHFGFHWNNKRWIM